MKIKKVLIVAKETQLELYKKDYPKEKDLKNFFIEKNIEESKILQYHNEHYQNLEKTKKIFLDNNIYFEILNKNNLTESDFKKNWDIIASFGGDGTVLETASHIKNKTPFLGIISNSRSYGELCSIKNNEIESKLERLIKNDFSIIEKDRTKAIINNGETIIDHALNEIVISDKYFSGFAKFDLYKKDKVFDIGSSGIMIASYYGKTGWFDQIHIVIGEKPEIIEKYDKLHKATNLPSEKIYCKNAEFKEDEKDLLRYKIMAIKYPINIPECEYGIIKKGEELKVVSKFVKDGFVHFDGNKPEDNYDGNKPDGFHKRAYPIHYGNTIRIMHSEFPLNVIDFN